MTTTLLASRPMLVRVGRRVAVWSAQWAAALQAESNDPEYRAVIRQAIREGLARVRPMPDDPEQVIVQIVRHIRDNDH